MVYFSFHEIFHVSTIIFTKYDNAIVDYLWFLDGLCSLFFRSMLLINEKYLLLLTKILKFGFETYMGLWL